MENRIIFAVKNNLDALVESYLSKDNQTEHILCNGNIALRIAIKNNNITILSLLLDHVLQAAQSRYGCDTTDYNIARHYLRLAVTEALRSYDPDEATKNLLRHKLNVVFE